MRIDTAISAVTTVVTIQRHRAVETHHGYKNKETATDVYPSYRGVVAMMRNGERSVGTAFIKPIRS